MELAELSSAPQTWASGATCLVFVQQHALVLFRIYRAIVQLAVVEEDLDERRALVDGALDQRFRERVLDVLLQRATQRASTVAAVGERLVEDPLLGLVV